MCIACCWVKYRAQLYLRLCQVQNGTGSHPVASRVERYEFEAGRVIPSGKEVKNYWNFTSTFSAHSNILIISVFISSVFVLFELFLQQFSHRRSNSFARCCFGRLEVSWCSMEHTVWGGSERSILSPRGAPRSLPRPNSQTGFLLSRVADGGHWLITGCKAAGTLRAQFHVLWELS